MFDTHLKIQYKIQSDKLMHLFFIYENKIKTLKDTSRKVRKPSVSIVKGIKKIFDESIAVITKGDHSEKIFQQIVILQSRKYSTKGKSSDNLSQSSITKIYDLVQTFEYDRLNQLFAQFLGLLGQHDISDMNVDGKDLISTINEHLGKWRNIRSQLTDLKDEQASKIMVAFGADSYTTCWKNTIKEVEQVIKVLEKLHGEYQEINQ